MMDEHDRLEAQATVIKARQKARENAVPLRALKQIRNLALCRDGHVWDLIVALADEAMRALAPIEAGTGETAQPVRSAGRKRDQLQNKDRDHD